MFRKLLSFLGRPDLDAATQPKPVATPKTRAGSKAYPSYFCQHQAGLQQDLVAHG